MVHAPKAILAGMVGTVERTICWVMGSRAAQSGSSCQAMMKPLHVRNVEPPRLKLGAVLRAVVPADQRQFIILAQNDLVNYFWLIFTEFGFFYM